jgi:hypothetical protein
MILSTETLDVLKNFSGINSNIYILPGNTIKTCNESGTIIAMAEVQETFQDEIAIYDVSEFLNTLNLLDVPDFSINPAKTAIVFNDSRSKVVYYLASTKVLSKKVVELATKNFNVVDPKVSFLLSAEDLLRLRKASSVFSLDQLMFVSDNGKNISAVVKDPEVNSSNEFILDVGESSVENDVPFSIMVSFSQLKFIKGDYMMNFYLQGNGAKIAEFVHTGLDLRYFCGLDRSSTFGDQ